MSDDSDRKERGRRSPSFALQEAVGFLAQVRQNLGEGTFSREAIAEALGHRGVTGAVTTKIGTLTHFGLLEREGSVYKVSAIGKRILHPLSDSDRMESLALAARSPVLYDELLKAFAGKSLPSMFANALIHNFGILSDNAAEVAKLFRSSMETCGLLRNGILYTSLAEMPTSADLHEPKAEKVRPAATEAPTSPAEVSISSIQYQEYAIPLSKTRTAMLRIPSPARPQDLERISKWLTFFADVLQGDDADND
ncbi:Uncharacterized protein OS=Bacillus methylotrophicus GN=NG74_03796 PE=4 SV=1 [Tuwongella immobilis]|uniref:Uncharacterized protein n=2 Tax=Tuwongella immobilis TaxID=692036 RepID=A0A6C2YI56_9BACT|nr:Uncharacterized protein OS=Bacillus methylotrophicus GN=NG74_03796 PE=4 SV=1 [Tuwongella immobilis]VTR97320.1 Uncharacterized protein OS=Bacillus methylotrophicus GN=NG74_03796 PE=4 SV=1 [Tuwongella immobilis]